MTQYAAVGLRVMTVTFGTVASANAKSNGAVLDDAAQFLDGAGQEPGVFER
jgi:hypothetical protein